MQVQREDGGTEVEMTENIDYGDTELRARHVRGRPPLTIKNPLASYGYQEQEIKDNEFVSVNQLPSLLEMTQMICMTTYR